MKNGFLPEKKPKKPAPKKEEDNPDDDKGY
jgi:hypothetical protein